MAWVPLNASRCADRILKFDRKIESDNIFEFIKTSSKEKALTKKVHSICGMGLYVWFCI